MPSKVKIVQILLSVLSGLVIFLGGSKYGIGLSPDGISYLSAASSLQREFKVLDYDGGVFAAWPPLYPSILAIGGTLLGDIQEFARILNIVSGVIITYVAFEFLAKSGVSLGNNSLLTFLVASSFPLLKNGVMLWSEPVFVVQLLVCLLLLSRQDSLTGKRDKIFLLIFTALLPLYRYLGVAMIITVIVYQLKNTPRRSVAQYLRVFILYSVLFLPLSLWCLRNKFLTGHLTGPRIPSSTTISETVWRLYDVGTTALIPMGLPNPVLTLSKWVVCGSVLLALMRIAFAAVKSCSKESLPAYGAIASIHALFISIYSLILCLGTLLVGLEPLSIRYLSPIIPSIYIVIGTQIPKIKRWELSVMIVLIPWALQSAFSCANLVSIWREDGAGDYSVTSWKESPTLQWIKANTIRGEVFSNASDFVFAETGQIFSRLPTPASLVQGEFQIEREITLVFFARSFRRYMAKREDFYPFCSIVPLAQFADGGVYTCTLNKTEKPLGERSIKP